MAGICFSELCGFHTRQWEATEAADTHRFTLFGGSRGPGKSYWLRWDLLRLLLRHAACGLVGVHVGLFCESYPELVDRQVNKVKHEFPSWLGEVRESRTDGFGYHLLPEYGGGVLAFRNLDDPSKYKSVEFAAVGVDELTRIPQGTFDILRGSMRWPGVDQTRFLAASNPDGRYADYVREMWVEHKFPPELGLLSPEFVFVPALPTDNPYLSSEYWRDLNTLPDYLKDPWLRGDWYGHAQGVVYSEFSDANVTDAEPDLSQPIELAFDDGYIDPRVILFIQRTGTRILVFDEIYHARHLDEESVHDMLERCARLYGKAIPVQADTRTLEGAATWCQANGVKLPEIAVGGSESVQLMRRFKQANIPARGGTHEIVEGIKVVRRLTRDGNGVRTLQIHNRCASTLKEITRGYQYAADARHLDEKPVDANNHACDALRYWVWMRARR